MIRENSKQKLLPLTFATLHLMFILHLHHESYKESVNHFLLLPLLFLPFYFALPFNYQNIKGLDFTKNTLAFSIGFIGTVLLQNFFNPVLASALFATIFVLLSEFKTFNLKPHQTAMYTGTFGGMLSEDWIPNSIRIIISCIIGGLLFSLFKSSLTGFGGKMGTIGFASLIIWIILQW